MEDYFSGIGKEENQMELPPGFRFHPTDEELITHYLSKKVADSDFSATAIGEVDMNKVEPWELPWRAKLGEKEWYFFCMRDKKYPTGLRTNRATASGYWKATGKDKEIFRGKSLVGMKKTLVFYKGRAPKGEKTNWVIHEYRLEGKLSLHDIPKSAKNECVICRVFQKTSGGKKVPISALLKVNSMEKELVPSSLPPLTDYLPYAAKTAHVPCFSIPISSQAIEENMINCLTNPPLYCSSSNLPNDFPFSNTFQGDQTDQIQSSLQNQCSVPMPDEAILKGLLENYGLDSKQSLQIEKKAGLVTDINAKIASTVSNLDVGRKSFGEQEAPPSSAGILDLDCMWSF